MIGRAGERAPDLIEPVVGYRTFDVRIRKGILRTTYAFEGPYALAKTWKPGTNVAKCRSHPTPDRRHSTAAPDRHCSCGLYGYYELPEEDETPTEHVVALCTYWGRIVPHQSGFRAEFARIQAVAPWAWPGLRTKVLSTAQRYGVDPVPHPRELESLASNHGKPLPPEMRPRPYSLRSIERGHTDEEDRACSRRSET